MKNKKKGSNKNDKYKKILIYAIVIILTAAALSLYLLIQNKEKEENIAYTQFIQDIDEGKVEKIEMTARKFNIKGNIQK